MKTASLVLKLCVCSALAIGLGFGPEASGQTAKTDSRDGQKSNGHPAGLAAGKEPRGKIVPAEGKNVKSKKFGNRSKLPEPGHPAQKFNQLHPTETGVNQTPANGLPQAGMNKLGIAAKPGTTMNKPANHPAETAKLPIGAGLTPPSNRVVREREGTTAMVGGLAKAHFKNSAGAINGTGVKRKP